MGRLKSGVGVAVGTGDGRVVGEGTGLGIPDLVGCGIGVRWGVGVAVSAGLGVGVRMGVGTPDGPLEGFESTTLGPGVAVALGPGLILSTGEDAGKGQTVGNGCCDAGSVNTLAGGMPLTFGALGCSATAGVDGVDRAEGDDPAPIGASDLESVESAGLNGVSEG